MTIPRVLVLLAATVTLAAAETHPPGEAEALLARLQAHYDETRAVSLEFTQRYVNRATGRSIQEKGTLLAAKPGLMRWDYRDPAKLYLLKDGVSWFYVPEEKVVYRATAEANAGRHLPALFLAGKADLTKEYRASLEATSSGKVLKLVPLTASEDYDYLLVEVDRESTALRALSVIDVLGNVTTFEFRDEKRDPALPEGCFDFTPPKDAEVVEAR